MSLFSKALVFSLLTALVSLQGCNSKEKHLSMAPDFSLEDLSGNRISLKDQKGQYVLIDFWATWCPPCRISIPELVEIHKKYKDRGLVVLGISLDDPKQVDNRALAAFRDQNRIQYMILRGNEKVVKDYSGAGGMAIPTMYFVDREGRVVEKLVGFAPGRLETSLKRLLG